MHEVGNTVNKTTVLKALTILFINFHYVFGFIQCFILTADFTKDLNQRKEEVSVKDDKQRRRKRIYFEGQIWKNFKIKIYYCSSVQHLTYFKERKFRTLQNDASSWTSSVFVEKRIQS